MTRNGHAIPGVGRFAEAHGKAKSLGTELVFEAVPDGVRDAEPTNAEAQPSPNGKPFTSETARSAAERRWALAKLPDFARQELDFVAADAFRPFDGARRDILAGKLDELRDTFGCNASSGVAAVVRGWAWLLSFGEFYAVRAATAGSDDDADRSRRFFKDASIELAKVHELMRAESAAHRGSSPATPWLEGGKP